MANALVHKIEVDDRIVVETAFALKEAVLNFRDTVYEDLDTTYVVERIKERLSDGSVKHMIRIREAEYIGE